jgi:hypothetical protein
MEFLPIQNEPVILVKIDTVFQAVAIGFLYLVAMICLFIITVLIPATLIDLLMP